MTVTETPSTPSCASTGPAVANSQPTGRLGRSSFGRGGRRFQHPPVTNSHNAGGAGGGGGGGGGGGHRNRMHPSRPPPLGPGYGHGGQSNYQHRQAYGHNGSGGGQSHHHEQQQHQQHQQQQQQHHHHHQMPPQRAPQQGPPHNGVPPAELYGRSTSSSTASSAATATAYGHPTQKSPHRRVSTSAGSYRQGQAGPAGGGPAGGGRGQIRGSASNDRGALPNHAAKASSGGASGTGQQHSTDSQQQRPATTSVTPPNRRQSPPGPAHHQPQHEAAGHRHPHPQANHPIGQAASSPAPAELPNHGQATGPGTELPSGQLPASPLNGAVPAAAAGQQAPATLLQGPVKGQQNEASQQQSPQQQQQQQQPQPQAQQPHEIQTATTTTTPAPAAVVTTVAARESPTGRDQTSLVAETAVHGGVMSAGTAMRGSSPSYTESMNSASASPSVCRSAARPAGLVENGNEAVELSIQNLMWFLESMSESLVPRDIVFRCLDGLSTIIVNYVELLQTCYGVQPQLQTRLASALEKLANVQNTGVLYQTCPGGYNCLFGPVTVGGHYYTTCASSIMDSHQQQQHQQQQQQQQQYHSQQQQQYEHHQQYQQHQQAVYANSLNAAASSPSAGSLVAVQTQHLMAAGFDGSAAGMGETYTPVSYYYAQPAGPTTTVTAGSALTPLTLQARPATAGGQHYADPWGHAMVGASVAAAGGGGGVGSGTTGVTSAWISGPTINGASSPTASMSMVAGGLASSSPYGLAAGTAPVAAAAAATTAAAAVTGGATSAAATPELYYGFASGSSSPSLAYGHYATLPAATGSAIQTAALPIAAYQSSNGAHQQQQQQQHHHHQQQQHQQQQHNHHHQSTHHHNQHHQAQLRMQQQQQQQQHQLHRSTLINSGSDAAALSASSNAGDTCLSSALPPTTATGSLLVDQATVMTGTLGAVAPRAS